MTKMFNAKFNSEYETPVLENRHKILRNLFRASRNLLEQKGFSWDESRQQITEFGMTILRFYSFKDFLMQF